MMNRDELVTFYRRYRTNPLLSAYVDADQSDPAQRDTWRVKLKQGLAQERDRLADADREERRAFESAVEHLRESLPVEGSSLLPGRGWVAFADADAVVRAETLPVPMPDLVRWERGPRIAPYVRALKQERPVFVVLLDQREGYLHRYRNGELEHLEDLHADTFLGDLTDMGTAKRATQRTGVRGKTATDAADAIFEHASDQLNNRIVARLQEKIGPDATLLLGGVGERTAAFRASLPPRLAERTHEVPELHLRMSDSEVKKWVEEAASEMSERRIGRVLEEVVDRTHGNGTGCLGRKDTERALRERRVSTLLVSEGLSLREPDYADHLVGSAFGSNGAEAHVLTRENGQRLEREGDGVAALLHYPAPNPDSA